MKDYTILAQKYRPTSFEELKGQTHAVRPLTNAFDQKKLHHAYLFTGTRGVGKTTFGRILAKCFNCEEGITSTPCNQCSNCQEISKGTFPDLIEVDAASKTKVEDTRELLDNTPYTPTKGRFKIYLIDEVHMLSNHSFNALLKTLEEPPAHVKFLLATTDPEKLPATIISRCLQFHLKHLNTETIQDHLEFVLEKEKIPFEKPAIKLIAQRAKGSMRDALTLLDQAIAFCGENITTSDTENLLGTIDTTSLLEIFNALKTQDANKMMEITQKISEKTADFSALLQSLISLIYDITLAKLAPNAIKENSADTVSLSESFTSETLQQYYKIALTSQEDIYLAPTPKIGFDMVLLRMLAVKAVKTQPASPAQKTNQMNVPQTKPQAIKQSTQTPLPEKPTEVKPPQNRTEEDQNIKAIIDTFNATIL